MTFGLENRTKVELWVSKRVIEASACIQPREDNRGLFLLKSVATTRFDFRPYDRLEREQ